MKSIPKIVILYVLLPLCPDERAMNGHPRIFRSPMLLTAPVKWSPAPVSTRRMPYSGGNGRMAANCCIGKNRKIHETTDWHFTRVRRVSANQYGRRVMRYCVRALLSRQGKDLSRRLWFPVEYLALSWRSPWHVFFQCRYYAMAASIHEIPSFLSISAMLLKEKLVLPDSIRLTY